jgi:DNA-binding XRE family transcriptional regulator
MPISISQLFLPVWRRQTLLRVSPAAHFLYSPPLPSHYLVSRDIPPSIFNPSFPADPVTIGDVIRKLRIERGMFQRELAEAMGVDETSIYNWENSRTRPKEEHIQKLEAYFSINFEEFLCLSNERQTFSHHQVGLFVTNLSKLHR